MTDTSPIHFPNKRLRSSSQGTCTSSTSPRSGGSTCSITTLSSWFEEGCSTCTSDSSEHDAASTSPGCHRLLLLDLRPAAEQQRRRLAGIHRQDSSQPPLVIASLPLEEVKARSFELPPRYVRFSILVESDDNQTHVRTAEQFLLQPDRVASNNRRKFRPWEVDNILVADQLFWREAREMKLIEDGRESESDFGCEQKSSSVQVPSLPSPRLWDADGMVEKVLLPLLRKEIAATRTTSRSRKRWRIYDMASGAGRDAAFLAEELLSASAERGGARFHVTAIDHRYNAKQTNIVQDFFQRRGVRGVTSVVKANLSRWETMREILLSGRKARGAGGDDGDGDGDGIDTVDILYLVRFFVRSAIRDLASCSSLRKGTVFAISHFCAAEDGGVWPFDHPHAATVLGRNEMKDLFIANGWDVLHDEIVSDGDHGRTLLNFVARKG